MCDHTRLMPEYFCGRRVHALRIAAIEIGQDGSAKIAPKEAGYGVIETREGYGEVFKGGDGDLGFYAVDADSGQELWLSNEAFDSGYLRPVGHPFSCRSEAATNG